MAEAIGAAASIIGIIGAAFTVIQEIRNARGRVRGTSETLDNMSKHLDAIDESLGLVREEEKLQTARVELQVKAITNIATELRSFLDNLAARQREKAVSQFFHALKSGDKDDKKLQGILDQLDRARNELRLRISVAQVGLLGNLQDGFRVAFGVLEQTNTRVNKVLGINLALMDIVKNRALQQTGQTADGFIPVNAADVLAIGMSAPDDTTSMNSSNEARETNIYGNVTLGQARIMTGNIGVEDWQKIAGRKTTIANNQFGHDVRIITGDMGGEAARGFNDSFWNSLRSVVDCAFQSKYAFVEKIARFQREERFQVLAAYTQRGIKLSRVYRGSTDTATFVDFVAQLLRHCGRWPEPESVLVMDNASIHCSDEIKQMCDEAGVKLEMTAPYTPDTNPIEEYFAEMKAYVKLRWDEHISLIQRDFGSYVRSCVQAVGERQTSAEGNFRNVGLAVEQPP
ncbi:hypothetical protein FOXYS1_13215 [Fusarium oxysporum]|uniref:Tc1-like transposase DDE domain-containing protein n=1 Tax=Fusarium oxysporum TaxID=5507 RepID=A0A8H5EE97_FUSOX|nr:hypothetical protein FOXYS1_13215 [Fusarium oxysporum]